MNTGHKTAVFGGGCFWCTEVFYKRLKGVVSVIPGYAGGEKENPSYEEVSAGETGHAEVIEVEYDPAVIPYEKLLEVFFGTHDPTTHNRQGNDLGPQYRSLILYADEAQRAAAENYIHGLETSKKYKNPIVTEIRPLVKFYPAEDYHRDYYAKHPDEPYSRGVIKPKLLKLEKEYSDLLKK